MSVAQWPPKLSIANVRLHWYKDLYWEHCIQMKSAFVQFFDFSTPISFWCIRLVFLSFPFLNITSIFTTVFLQQFFFQQFFFVTITCYKNIKICQLCRGHVELRKKILWNQTKTRTFKKHYVEHKVVYIVKIMKKSLVNLKRLLNVPKLMFKKF